MPEPTESTARPSCQTATSAFICGQIIGLSTLLREIVCQELLNDPSFKYGPEVIVILEFLEALKQARQQH